MERICLNECIDWCLYTNGQNQPGQASQFVHVQKYFAKIHIHMCFTSLWIHWTRLLLWTELAVNWSPFQSVNCACVKNDAFKYFATLTWSWSTLLLWLFYVFAEEKRISHFAHFLLMMVVVFLEHCAYSSSSWFFVVVIFCR